MSRLGRPVAILFACVVLFSIAGLNELLALVAPVIFFIGIYFVIFLPFSRGKGGGGGTRQAHKLNTFGEFDDPIGIVGHAVVMVFAVKEVAEATARPYDIVGGAIVFAAAIGVRLASKTLSGLLFQVMSGIAAAALLVRIAALGPEEAAVSKVLFWIAAAITAAVLVGSWGFSWTPATVFQPGLSLRLIAAFALLELAAVLAFPAGFEVGGLPVDAWADPATSWLHWTVAIFLFGVVALFAAYGPEFVSGLLGIALAFAALSIEGYDHGLILG